MKWNSHYICLMVARRFPSIRCFLPIVMLLTGWTSIGAASSFEVKVFGKGIPMILIPGIACSGDVWKSTVVQYQDRYECHVITLAGFAGVPPEQSDWFLDQVKNDLIFYIKEKHLQKPVIVGHALGGFVALWLTSTEPDLVSRVIIVDALPFLPAAFYPSATPASSAPFANQLRQKLLNQTDEQFQQAQISNFKNLITDSATAVAASQWGIASDKATVAEVTYEMQTIDLRDEIEKIKCPVLVFATYLQYSPVQTHDGIAALFNAQYAKLRNYRLAVADHARHYLMLDDPEFMFSEMDPFLAAN